MRIKSYTTMPFDNRNGPELSPLTNKSRPFQIDRDYDRRLQLGLDSNDHTLIDSGDTDGKSWVINPFFEGEFNWNRSGFDINTKKDYFVVLYNGPPLTFKNKTYNQIIDIMTKNGLKWRIISPFDSSVKSSSGSSFINLVSEILPSCFKIESESYKYNVKEIGSCFYIHSDYMLTCAHVVSKHGESLNEVGAFLVDGNKKYPARVVDIDKNIDCALLYCDSIQHSVLKCKNCSSVDVGKDILCIGSPYGYDNNVTKGILSSKDRIIEDKIPYFFMDLSVFPGSSGGPVIDISDKKVFGMASVIVESVGNYGLNAGVPIEICINRFSKFLKGIDYGNN